MLKNRVSDGSRTRDNWSHNPQANSGYREVSHSAYARKLADSRPSARVSAPGVDSLTEFDLGLRVSCPGGES